MQWTDWPLVIVVDGIEIPATGTDSGEVVSTVTLFFHGCCLFGLDLPGAPPDQATAKVTNGRREWRCRGYVQVL